MWRLLPLGLGLVSLSGCNPSGEEPRGLGRTRPGGGPAVVWDVTHLPLPEVPLPNDQATRLDPGSPTGRRVNVSLGAVTRYESRTRALFDGLDGFGAYAPITVGFDAALAIEDLAKRHADDDFRNDAIYLLNVDRSCARFGEEIAIDLGRGRFPITLMSRSVTTPDPEAPGGLLLDESDNKLFRFDPVGESLNVLFPDRAEDLNANGRLDPGEDVNGDGRLDVPNFLDPGACDGVDRGTLAWDRCVADNLLGWYERSTHTLTFRPVWPLEERCTHAVVLTRRLEGASGEPVRSPFPAVQAADQIPALSAVEELLPRYGLDASDVAFAWSFTTGTMTRDLEALRAGLHASGPFAHLAKEFPVSTFDVKTRNEWRTIGGDATLDAGGEARLVAGGCVGSGFARLAGTQDGDQQICAGHADFASIGGVFAGSFTTPNLLVDKDGEASELYPADDDEAWDLDVRTGRATYGSTDTTFFCALPREDARPSSVECTPGNPEGKAWCKPYPVAFYAHGYGSFKGEAVLHAGRHTQLGFAACGLDSYGHGRSIVLQEGCEGAADYATLKLLLGLDGVPELPTMIFTGRDRDLNGDGCRDGGADQWTANLFHTRDIVRQSVLEEIQFVRILHSMDGKNRDADGNVLGDVDGDGEPDLGGRTNTVGAWGISLGGQITAVLAGAEPALDAVVPNAGGAGLTDIAVRLGEGGLAEAVMLPVQGPVLVGCLPVDAHQNPLAEGEAPAPCLDEAGAQQGLIGPQPAGEMAFAWYGHDNARLTVRGVGRVSGVRPGDRVVLENLDKGLRTESVVGPRGWVRLNIAADALSMLERRRLLGVKDDDREPARAPDTRALGDRVRITVLDGASGAERGLVDEFAADVTFQGTVFAAGQPLVALQEGVGYRRNSPDFRRFFGIAQHAISPADPAVWMPRVHDEPTDASYDPAWREGRAHVLVMPTIGDTQVPTATGVAMARAAGLLGSWRRDQTADPKHGWRELFAPDPRYGTSVEQWLIDQHVVEGDFRLQRWEGHDVNPSVLFDPDDVSDGTARFSCLHSADWSASIGENRCPPELDDTDTTFDVPGPPPGDALRADRARGDGTFDAFRVPLLRPAGQHGIYNPQPFRTFDADATMVSFVARYIATAARDVTHEAGCDCTFAAPASFVRGGAPAWPGIEEGPSCPADDTRYGKICSPECAAGWGFVPVPPAVCDP
ncbi:MAG: hypothetical protein FJ104_00250 [Deltaproteobacteria bacterium]|nr:hypothetical protein [Deltaproteobacteria bacterium]